MMLANKKIEWDDEKNAKLIVERKIGFEDVYVAILHGGLRDIVHGKKPKYAHQRIFVVFIDGYTYPVPFVEDGKRIFLKTIYPSRELHKKYSGGRYAS